MVKQAALLLLTFISLQVAAQQKVYSTTKVNTSIKINGIGNDAAWQNIPVATNFINTYPNFGKPESKQTEVKIVYDNAALYVLAVMYNDKKNTPKQLTQRDVIERQDCDFFSIGLDTYHDRQNAFVFQVTSAGVQGDARQSNANGFDRSWDAVWESAVSIDVDRWTAEIKIPFSAIRFAKKDIQSWGLQLSKSIRYLNESVSWAPQDPNVDGSINQWGELSNLKDIVPPVRLSFLPYLSGGVNSVPSDNGFKQDALKSGGMDVKYGVNESFTLDVTLIPDFAQVQSDNVFLNLSPFEVQFTDFRQFFTEGTELFNKAGLFYSRRIGAEPGGTQSVLQFAKQNPEYSIKKNPGITRLYNAFKFSGRTKNNVGIGVFNAITAPMKAVLTNNNSKQDTTITTEPLSNYNVFVWDKAYTNRSSITFTNTNVLRQDKSRQANVAALDVEVFDKKNVYSVFGNFRLSNIWGKQEKYSGYKTEFGFGKVSGKWQWGVNGGIESDKYDPNDLGFLQNNNSVEQEANISLNYNYPTKKFLIQRYSFNINNSYLYKPFKWQGFELNASALNVFKNFWDITYFINSRPIDFVDYFEARTFPIPLKRFAYVYAGARGSTDSRKKLFVNASFGVGESRIKDDTYIDFTVGGRYRFSDKFQLNANYNGETDNGQWGYSHRDTMSTLVSGINDPIIAFRVQKSRNLVIGGQYSFTPRMNWTIRMRHNWTNVKNRTFHKLKADGNWDDIAFSDGRNRNFNVFNIDMFYTWDFKWGSRLTLGWKNALGGNVLLNAYDNIGYLKNFGQMFNNPHSNELTVKLVYFIDYLDIKKKRKS
jgi:Domain of unknown function (DUF5916)/Carbohydrate family 9 binding domain-like